MAAAGRLIGGRYRILRPLAVGGMGPVWLAIDETLDRQVAIKRYAVPDGLTADERELVRGLLLREARATARINHPHVIHTLDVLPDADEPWLVMEYLPARSLLQVIEESGPLPVARVAGIGLAVLSALDAAGRAGVLHLDVKPGNVLIVDDGRIVLTDFGPAVTGPGIAALAGAGILLGSPKYVAPERVADGVSTARSDLWSLGATLYHAVEGRPPYVRETTTQTLQALADSLPEPPRRAGPLRPVLEGLLQHDPAARLTAAEVQDRLRRIADQPGPVAEPPAAAGPPARAGGPPAAPAGRVRSVLGRRVAALAAMLFVLAAAAVTAQRDDSAGTRTGQARTLSAQAVAPSESTPVLPPRFRWWNDPSGFRVAVPAQWRQTPDRPGALALSAPHGEQSLRISSWTPEPPNIAAALIAQERAVRLMAYRRIRIDALPAPPDAVWEYTFEDPRAGPMRGLEQVVAGDGRVYLIEWRAPKAAWAAALPDLSVVVDSFRARQGA
jgi:eukaryotic-like serine/threonine-protein kinase